MRTLQTITELRTALMPARRRFARIGLVPTMGAFHAGHLSLMRQARADCDLVVVSLFVNPAQFDEAADLVTYPRDLQRDAALAANEDADFLFAPSVEEIYPAGFATTISVGGPAEGLEGAHRGPRHFEGVATVVTKLCNIVSPEVVYFGQKDAQQVLVIRQLVRDLNLPVRIETCPTVREQDGLAMSSRNVHLTPAERDRAGALSRSLALLRALVAAGEDDAATLISAAMAELVTAAGLEVEYLEVVNPETLRPTETIEGTALVLVAARIGKVRLIDNELLTLHANGSRPPVAAGSERRRE